MLNKQKKPEHCSRDIAFQKFGMFLIGLYQYRLPYRFDERTSLLFPKENSLIPLRNAYLYVHMIERRFLSRFGDRPFSLRLSNTISIKANVSSSMSSLLSRKI